jgi:hypothetical protein
MPLPSKKPPLKAPIQIVLPHGKSKPGKWDGAHWWIQASAEGPYVPIRDSFIKEWRAVA